MLEFHKIVLYNKSTVSYLYISSYNSKIPGGYYETKNHQQKTQNKSKEENR